MESEKTIWLIWAQNTKTNIYTAFSTWANDADEAAANIHQGFFDSKCTAGISFDTSGNAEFFETEEDPFPSSKMKMLEVKKFDSFEDLLEYREKSREEKYRNE